MTDAKDMEEIESGNDGKTLLSGVLCSIAIVFLGIIFFSFFTGCKSTPSGVKVKVSSASYTNVGDINWDEYKIPVLSLYFGPRATLWVNKDFKCLREVKVTGTVTNTTTTLGIYKSEEKKILDMRLTFDDSGCVTNAPAASE